MSRLPFLVHALSPLHAGVGDSAGIIDLPIARMKGTGIPFLPGSSIKGVMRDDSVNKDAQATLAVYGPETGNAGDHKGALTVSDARLLALPVRSFVGTFAWVTSPLLLLLARRDLNVDFDVPQFANPDVPSVITTGNTCIHNGKVYLEDLDLEVVEGDLSKWVTIVDNLGYPDKHEIFTKRFLVVDDETMTFLWETATQIDTRIRIDPMTRTVATGALWIEESLPPETLLMGVMEADKVRGNHRDGLQTPDQVLEYALQKETILQFGGKATVGRGRCRLVPMPGLMQRNSAES